MLSTGFSTLLRLEYAAQKTGSEFVRPWPSPKLWISYLFTSTSFAGLADEKCWSCFTNNVFVTIACFGWATFSWGAFSISSFDFLRIPVCTNSFYTPKVLQFLIVVKMILHRLLTFHSYDLVITSTLYSILFYVALLSPIEFTPFFFTSFCNGYWSGSKPHIGKTSIFWKKQLHNCWQM